MHRLKTNSLRLLFRKPYKVLLCSLAGFLVVLFTVTEGVQMTGTRAAMDEAVKSRVYTGTLAHAAEGVSGYYHDSQPVGRDAYEILAASPYVEEVRSCETRTARFGGGTTYVRGDAAGYSMIVGVAASDITTVGNDEYAYQKILFRPTYVAAGDPDAFHLGYSETSILPSVMLSPADESLTVRRGERYFVYAEADHEPKTECSQIRVFNPPKELEMYYPQSTALVGEKPGDEALSDEEFAAKVMREHDLEKKAENLDSLLDLTAVIEIPTLDMLLPWRSNLMRLVSGRAITEADAGKKICMCPSAMLAALGKRVGDTLLLSVSEHDLSGGSESGIPSVSQEYDRNDFGSEEEYEIVGSYSNDSSFDIDAATRDFFLSEILIPRPADRPYEPVTSDRFSFSVHKDSYESYLFDTERKLSEAGYTVIMARPEYAEVEAEFETLRQKTFTQVLTSGLALGTGILIAAGALVLFWRNDYLTERRLGANRREASCLYLRAFAVVSAASAILSAVTVFLLGETGLVPFLSPDAVSAAVWGTAALFALAALLVFALAVMTAVFIMDKRKIGG